MTTDYSNARCSDENIYGPPPARSSRDSLHFAALVWTLLHGCPRLHMSVPPLLTPLEHVLIWTRRLSPRRFETAKCEFFCFPDEGKSFPEIASILIEKYKKASYGCQPATSRNTALLTRHRRVVWPRPWRRRAIGPVQISGSGEEDPIRIDYVRRGERRSEQTGSGWGSAVIVLHSRQEKAMSTIAASPALALSSPACWSCRAISSSNSCW